MPEYWNWCLYQWWIWRRYKRADRKAYARECAEIRRRAVWRG